MAASHNYFYTGLIDFLVKDHGYYNLLPFTCTNRMATRIKTHPTICTGASDSAKNINPNTAANTASILSRIAASVGGAYFCPNTWRV
jgi:hypothetical protein